MDEENNTTTPEEEVETPEVDENVQADEEMDMDGENPQDNPYNLKEGFGRKEYEKTIGDRDYYKKQGEELKKRQDQARMEQANRYKRKANGEEEPDEAPSSSGNPTSQSGEQKELTKEERDEQRKSSTTSEEEKKSLKDRAKDAKNTHDANKAVAQNKINEIKSKAYKTRHPVEAAKAEAKEKIKKKAKAFLIKYWWVVLIAALVLLLLIMIFLIFMGLAGEEESDADNGYLDPKYDYTQVLVQLTNSYTNEADKVELDRKITLEDLVLGSVYFETRNHVEGLNDDQLLELYKSYAVLLKTEALALGGYSNENMEISIKSGSELPYCDPYNGCVVKTKNGIKTYVSKAYEDDVEGTVTGEVGPMDEHQRKLLQKAYGLTTYEILVPKDVDEPITGYSYTNPPYDLTTKTEVNDSIKSNKDYEKALKKTYDGYKVYDIRDYATYYSYTSNTAYWWPIGSSSPSSGNIYGGNPTSTTITSEFVNNRCIQGVCKAHKGIDIGGSYGTSVIIATRSGTVTTASDGCASTGSYGNTCGGGYGNYIIIDHGDGTSSVYAHMYQNSLAVKTGDKVSQGQKIGLMGSSGSSTGPHLHFEVRINGTQNDPLKYVDPKNPRPVAATGDGTVVNGNSNVQTVCLSLKASGFSNEAVAGIMANIESESGFRTSVYGDNGTSAGLCQWHLGRLSNMQSFCGSNWANDVGCQVKYLIHELKTSEKGAYNALIGSGSAYDMGAAFCTKFERPANTSNCYSIRGTNAQNKYYPYVKNNCSN